MGRNYKQNKAKVQVSKLLEEIDDSPNNSIQSLSDPIDTKGEPLKAGITVIGYKQGKIAGKFVELTIYYGNYITPMFNDEFLHLKEDEYRKILTDFLSSNEGLKYERPSEQEIRQATQIVSEAEAKKLTEIRNATEEETPTSNTEEIKEDESPPKQKEISVDDTEKSNRENKPFKDDSSVDEQKAIEFIKNKNFSRKQIQEIRKNIDAEQKRHSFLTGVLVSLVIVLLAGGLFLARGLIAKSQENITLELKSSHVRIPVGSSFSPKKYIAQLSQSDDVYVIYPSLDTDTTGSFELEYVATNGIKNIKKTLLAEVVDITKPTLTLKQEEVHLVRNRDEESFDPLEQVQQVSDNIDKDLQVRVGELDWSLDMQNLTYEVSDSSGNLTSMNQRVLIEDKAICDLNAHYNQSDNTCICNSGYKGNGFACSVISSKGVNTSTQSETSQKQAENASGSDLANNSASASPPQPSPPANSGISASGCVVAVGTSMSDILARISVDCSSGYTVDYGEVNNSIAGSYTVYIYADNGESTTCNVTVVEN